MGLKEDLNELEPPDGVFSSPQGSLDRILRSIDALEKHLAGRHDQSSHGRGVSGPGSRTGFEGRPANPAGKDTMERFRNPDGSWTKERQAMHDEIVESFFRGKTPVDKPTSYMMGGGPASGKSTMVRAGAVSIPENTVKVDADEIKGMIPEYKSMVGKKNAGAASFAHEESSYLSKRIADRAAREGYNVLLDGTGDSSVESLAKKAANMRARGQPVEAYYATCPTDVAVARNVERAKKTGRLPPESMLRATHASVSRIIPEAIKRGLFDKLEVWDTDSKPPKKLASAKGTELTVHDNKGWERFLAKADEGR